MWHSSWVILVTAPQLCGRRNLSQSLTSSVGLVLQANIPPFHPIYPPDAPSPCVVWRQLQWAPDVAWHPSSHRTGCGLKVVWKHHPPADPMKVPQTAARGFCRGFVFVRTAGAQKKCRSAHLGVEKGIRFYICACVTYSTCLSETIVEVLPSVSVDMEISTSFNCPQASILCSLCI